MSNWRELPLREIGRIITGKTPPTSDSESYGGEIPFVTPSDMDGRRTIQKTARTLTAKGVSHVKSSFIGAPSIVVSCIGSDMGKSALLDQPYVSNQQINSIIVGEDFDRLFVFYNLFSRKEEIQNKASGAAQPIMNKTDFGNLIIQVPDLAVQKSIGSALSALDHKIELNRRLNETLEGMAQAIFKDWFVDFGPTRRKLAGITDPGAIMGGLTKDAARATELAALFPDALGGDGLPVGWSEKPIEHSLVLQRGFDLPKTTRTDGNYPVIAASGPSGTHNEFKVRGPGVCTGRSGVLGGIFFVREDFWPLNTSLWIKEYPNATPLYAYYLLRTLDLITLNGGSAVPTLNRNHVHQIPVVTPLMAPVREFEKLATLLYDRMGSADDESRTLAETRDYLLPKLMSGEVRVRDYEKLAEGAPV